MARGGYRENAGRKSEWASSSQTRPLRVPEWMADQVIEFAKKLDSGETIETVHNQNSSGPEQELLDRVLAIVQHWADRTEGKESSPRWKNVHTLTQEILNEVESRR